MWLNPKEGSKRGGKEKDEMEKQLANAIFKFKHINITTLYIKTIQIKARGWQIE